MSKQTDLINIPDAITVSGSKVGIGTTNPTVAAGTGLVINGGTNQARLALKNDATGDGSGDGFQIVVTSGSGSNGGQAIFEQRENNIIAFKTNSSETMRIDSSGNLLVGKTSSSTTTAGNELRAGGLAAFTRSGSYSLNLNRLSSDGDIAVFQKDGTTVGSIGVLGNNNLTISGTQFNHCGLSFATNAILPTTESVTNNNTVDMGANGNAYKDLYLGGGVYLGGTGSANKLDDYEEGTWTPAVYQAGLTISSSTARYTKIGRLVTVTCDCDLSGTGNGNDMKISGLPFTSLSAGHASGSGYTQSYPSAQNGSNAAFVPKSGSNDTFVSFQNGNGQSYDGDRFSAGFFNFTITYFTA